MCSTTAGRRRRQRRRRLLAAAIDMQEAGVEVRRRARNSGAGIDVGTPSKSARRGDARRKTVEALGRVAELRWPHRPPRRGGGWRHQHPMPLSTICGRCRSK